jgi:hypothetical protein
MTRTGSEHRARRIRRALMLTFAWCAGDATRALAQQPVSVSLRIEPPVGTTLRMRLDQRIEMSGTTRLPSGDSTATAVTTLLVISRAYVERRDGDATILLASTDSVTASSTGADSAMVAGELRRALQGKQVRLRVAPDGSTEILDGSVVVPELNALFAQMPATLPTGAVEVGQRWSRVMLAPAQGEAAGRTGGRLNATFRLDSLSPSGDWAYVSIVGALTRPASSKDGWATLSMSGSVDGAFVLDRRRGWIRDARLAYTVRSVLAPSAGGSGAAMRFRMKVTQWMRAVP